jgi:23S rRNA (adenine2503-C2)-methyltransferase
VANRAPELTGLIPAQVEQLLVEAGEAKYRAKQVLDWVYSRFKLDYNEMTNLSLALRERLPELISLNPPKILETSVSSDGTAKYLLDLYDHRHTEMVLIPGKRRSVTGKEVPKHTLCMSSQTGCARGCGFCATARIGKFRSLETHEMVTEVLLAAKLLSERETPAKLTNIVLMGMGEPMDNLDNVLSALSILQDNQGMSFSPRRITLSTSGVVPGITKLIQSGVKVKLAVSLNSAIDAKRSQIMPVNKLYPLTELKKVLLDYQRLSTFRITLEYVMFGGFNLGPDDAKALRKFAGDLSCKINLIPWNPVPGIPFQAPTSEEITSFTASLPELSAAITLRKSMGRDIAAACGQLAGEKSV